MRSPYFSDFCYEIILYQFYNFILIESPLQALLYRLSGDYNPLHSDLEVAKVAGSVVFHIIAYLNFLQLTFSFSFPLSYHMYYRLIPLLIPHPNTSWSSRFILSKLIVSHCKDSLDQYCMDWARLDLQSGQSSNVSAKVTQTWLKAYQGDSFYMCTLAKLW